MKMVRTALALCAATGGMALAQPASAQFFLQSRDFSAPAVTGDEADLGQAMPDATPAERRAAMVWHMRAALNVAALQCQFEPTLLTVSNYNAILDDHDVELKTAFDTISKYFLRVNKAKGVKAGQAALDQFGTRTYSNFATVAAQYGFCQTTASIGRDALFTPRGQFGDLTLARTRELRNSLIPWGEQRFPRYIGRDRVKMPRLDPICWNKKAEWVAKKCGAQDWPPAVGVGIANR